MADIGMHHPDIRGYYETFAGLFHQTAQPGPAVFIHAERSGITAALLWAAYAAYVPYIPADKGNPVSRTQFIFEQTAPRYVFIDRDTVFYIEKFAGIKKNELWSEGNTSLFEIPENIAAVMPGKLSGVLFTSGTTGTPKGVMIPRTNTESFVKWMCATFAVDGNTKILSVSPLHFDLSVFDFFAPLFNGAKLCIPAQGFVMNPQYLAEFIFEHKTDTIYATPTWYSLLLQFGKVKKYNFDFVKTVLAAGEPFKTSLAVELHRVFPNASVSNLYGPTETNVCTYYTIDFSKGIKERNGIVSIGKACPYNRVKLNTENILEVEGETVTPGYWPQVSGNSVYNTGDIAEQDNEGWLYYITRADQMIKRNGYRIEPAEVESCLMSFGGVSQAAVTTGTRRGQTILAAHLVGDTQDITALRQHCLGHLPAYMMPDEFVFCDALPLTSSGKTDYKILQAYRYGE